MKCILNDNTSIEITNFTYGMNDLEEVRTFGSDTSNHQIANINITPDADVNMQRQVKSLYNMFSQDNVSTVTLVDEGTTRVYNFSKCICCQAVMSDSRDYIFIQLID